jgi:predicted nucleic acid-binding protein
VLAELHGHLIRRLEPSAAAVIVARLADDPMIEWHDVSVDLVQSALRDWVHRFHDQRFSLTDAVTFALMKRERLREAFAYDDDFTVAGFELLE